MSSWPGGYVPADFGADDIRDEDRGVYDHYVAYSRAGGWISWDVYKDGRYVDDSIHMHDSDRLNIWSDTPDYEPPGYGG